MTSFSCCGRDARKIFRPGTRTACSDSRGEIDCPWARRSARDTMATLLSSSFHALPLSLSPLLPLARTSEPANFPAWKATVWLTPTGRNVLGDWGLRCELALPLELPELAAAAAAWLAVPVSLAEGAGGAPAVTALITPARIVSARLG